MAEKSPHPKTRVSHQSPLHGGGTGAKKVTRDASRRLSTALLFRVLAGINAKTYVEVLDALELESTQRHEGMSGDEASPVVLELLGSGVEPARCRSCGFEFSGEKLTKPSKRPECHSTWVGEPKIGIERKTRGGEPSAE